jgi:hypothetical protein
MTTEPEQIRAQVEAVLAELPELDDSGPADLADTEIDAITSRLSAAHDMLVRALESAEKG